MRHPVLALVLAAVLSWPGVSARGGDGLVSEPFLRIRVTEAAGETVADVPRKLLDALGPTGATVPLGTWKGRALRLSVDRVLRDLKAVPASGPESMTALSLVSAATPLSPSASPGLRLPVLLCSSLRSICTRLSACAF